jgi:hypothetical protein
MISQLAGSHLFLLILVFYYFFSLHLVAASSYGTRAFLLSASFSTFPQTAPTNTKHTLLLGSGGARILVFGGQDFIL